jgi:pimeloyl-ACP methyl ester carboxylesterase
MKFLIPLLVLFSIRVYGQNEMTQDWSAFNQSLDVTSYQGGQFRFKGFVRVENANKLSNARLWARVDTEKGIGFFDNMNNRPISNDEWKEYIILGDIDQKAVSLIIGGLYFGSARYFFDRFSLELKTKNGEWSQMKINNPGFEDEIYQTGWKTMSRARGFESKLTTENVYEGEKAFMIDASSRAADDKFILANKINIHFKEFGKGDTVLLLHGNSESLESFSKQIPVFSTEFYVIAMDSRGQGYSDEDGKDLNYELMAEDVISFLDRLGIHQINIIGWSDGGNIGLILAMNHPDRIKSLSIMGANLYNDNTSVDMKVNKMIKGERDRLIKLNKSEDKFKIALLNLMLTEPNIKPESLDKIECPTLVMAGSKDVIKEEHTRLIASNIKKSQLVIFDKGTHYEPTENPERFNKTVMDFLRQIKK